MGCFCSRPRGEDQKIRPPPSFSHGAPEIGHFGGSHKFAHKIWDSGELRVLPSKSGGSGKVAEVSSILGRASVASLERAVEVLDTLGSSMSNLNASAGFASEITTRGNKISILAFEVANTIAKGAKLWRSLLDENTRLLKEDILQSDGVRKLVSSDANELLCIVATDKREELEFFAREVIRFGDLCKDPIWHNLGRYFQKMSWDLTPQEQSKQEVEATMQLLVNLAQHTSELYHELHALDRIEQDYKRKVQDEESLPAARRESLLILNSELKRQRKLVKSLKKKSLWSRNLEEVVEKLVDVVAFLDKQIFILFMNTGGKFEYEQAENQRLGASGLALHYANLITQIDNIVSRPLSLPPTTRDSLYHGLPPRVKAALRSRLQSFDANEEYTVAQIKTEMQKTLKWLVPMAENTVRAHQGFGWVGEWANMSTEVNKKPDLQHSVTRILTLHHADREKTEEHILELVIWLHHLVIQVKNRGYGFKAFEPVRSQPQTVTDAARETNQEPTEAQVSEDERQMLDLVSSRKTVFGRSKSLHIESSSKEKWVQTKRGRSRSCWNSPDKEFSLTLDLQFRRMRVLDVMDGLDTLDARLII